MFKKLLIGSGIFAFSSFFMITEAAPYVGANVGVVTNTSASSNFRGATGSLDLGYGVLFGQSAYIAGEIFGTLGTLTLDNNAGATNLHTTYGYGVSVIPGVLLSEHTIAFARVGVLKTRFSSMNSTKTGGQAGLGIQTGMTQNWDLRGEYDYVSYQKINGVTPRSDQFNLGIVYRFE